MDSNKTRKLLPTRATLKKAEKIHKKGISLNEDERNLSLRSFLSEGGVEIFCFVDLPTFGSVFWFLLLKLRFFGFNVLCCLRVFSNLGFGFRFFYQQ